MSDATLLLLINVSSALGLGSWLAAHLAMVWYAYALGKTITHPMLTLFRWSSATACLMMVLNNTILLVFITVGYSDKLFTMIDGHYEQLTNAMNWFHFISHMAWLAAGIAFVYCITHAKKHVLRTTHEDETSGAPT